MTQTIPGSAARNRFGDPPAAARTISGSHLGRGGAEGALVTAGPGTSGAITGVATNQTTYK